MSEGRGRGTSRWEALVWLAVLSVPPGIGMVGFVAVATAGGAVTTEAIVAGVATTGLIAGVLTVVLEFGPDEEATD